MTKLTQSQADLLAAAATALEGSIPSAADPRTIASLIKKGFLISVPQAEGLSHLLITNAGRDALAPEEVKVSDNFEPVPDPAPAQEPNSNPRGTLVAISQGTRELEGAEADEHHSSEKAPPAAAKPKGKVASLVELLRQPDGTTVEAMMAATGWQAHSVRGAMSGAIKKGLGLKVLSEKAESGRIYRIVAEAVA